MTGPPAVDIAIGYYWTRLVKMLINVLNTPQQRLFHERLAFHVERIRNERSGGEK